jgi:hypothetical protein
MPIHAIVAAALAFAALILLVLWLASDRTVYKGHAQAMPNKMPHYSKTTRTVFILVGDKVPGCETMVAEVPLSTAASIAAAGPMAPVQVTIKQRVFGKPRVTCVN